MARSITFSRWMGWAGAVTGVGWMLVQRLAEAVYPIYPGLLQSRLTHSQPSILLGSDCQIRALSRPISPDSLRHCLTCACGIGAGRAGVAIGCEQ
jgi:hypothetical protein